MAGMFVIEGEAYPATLSTRPIVKPDDAVIAVSGNQIWIHLDGRAHELIWRDAVSYYSAKDTASTDNTARAPMPGTVVAIMVSMGDRVKAGDAVLVIESMKLETWIKAPCDCVVETIHVTMGQSFDRDAVLITFSSGGS